MSGNVVSQSLRFARGLRTFLKAPISIEHGRAAILDGVANRDAALLALLDRSVWPFPANPYRQLLDNAGIEAGDVRALVAEHGLEGTLECLRDEGVYVAYEEYLGLEPAVRGSASFQLDPSQFANPHVRPDFTQTSGGTRSGGTASGSSFAERVHKAADLLVTYEAYGVLRAPGCVWMPALPSSAGIGGVLNRAAAGMPAERWLSPIDPRAAGIPLRKQAANWLLPPLARLYGARVPRARYTPTSDPGPVLEWCREALSRGGGAVLHAYPSSAVAVSQAAVERGISLEGLFIRCGGEPLTPARRMAVEASGATACQFYAFTPAGTVATACPRCEGDEMHLSVHAFGLVTRPRTRTDGVVVDAFLWTNLRPTAGQLLLNTENDDYGTLVDPGQRCDGPFDELGLPRKVRAVRGMSKVVAGGVTVDGEVLVHIVDAELPRRFGGAPTDYQFAEAGGDGVARLELRVSPRLAAIDEGAVVQAIEEVLNRDELGLLATSVWSPRGSISVVRTEPVAARSGKTLAFEPLRT